ncbi:hypothetical protein GGR02_003518 [Anoxybacillus voinovskiensis]|uniref:Uncharacterized protein n=1 Tax=Anoxybacteroides voinovskiense TaxID=230470 RepID=A0A840DRG3_9BACL|nr:hypothetical protein [Anoxybacillus voinovskiensis]
MESAYVRGCTFRDKTRAISFANLPTKRKGFQPYMADLMNLKEPLCFHCQKTHDIMI